MMPDILDTSEEDVAFGTLNSDAFRLYLVVNIGFPSKTNKETLQCWREKVVATGGFVFSF